MVITQKRLLALIFAALLLLSIVPAASADIWHYRKPIEIDHARVNADLNDFPVLISITDDTDLKEKAQDDGDDIVFTNSSLYRLDHEIEKFNKATGTLVAWVRVPSLSSTTPNTTIYLYYNNSECGNQQNPTGVWDSRYKMVQHLHETSKTAGTYNDHLDSTLNNKDGEAEEGVTMDATGKIDGVDDFDGSNDYVNVNTPQFNTPNALTIETWVKADVLPSDPSGIAGLFSNHANGADDDNSWVLSIHPNDICFCIYPPGTDYEKNSTSGISAGSWHHIAVVLNSSSSAINFYINGSFISDADGPSSLGITSANLNIGRYHVDNPSNQYWFDGSIDEVRISDVARSGHWINTSYNNQNDPSTFYSLGEEQNGNPDQPVPELPTIILLSVGLVVLAGYVCVVRKMRKGR